MLNHVAAISRLGTEDAFAVLNRADELTKQGKKIVNLGIGQPDFSPAPHIIEATLKALRDGPHGYSPPNGIPEIREAVSNDIHINHQVEVNPENIMIVPGGKVTIFFAVIMFGEPGAEIIFPDPGFPIYRSLIEYSGAKPVPLKAREGNAFSLCAEEIGRLLSPSTRLIIINSPSNPTGAVTSIEEMEKLASILDNHPQVVILSDEIYDRIIFGDTYNRSFLTFENLRDRLIVLNGWSKTFAMTGWRLGYGVWPSSLIEHATRLAINSYSCVNLAAQKAGIAALSGPQDNVEKMRKILDARRQMIVPALNNLPGITCQKPLGAFYAFPNVSDTGLSSTAFQKKLLEDAGVATISGSSFGFHGEGYLRISYANSIENIETAISRIHKFLNQQPSLGQ